ncbi:MAG: ATPase domain-containing protein [Candidatus Altiarchaeota archaeon]
MADLNDRCPTGIKGFDELVSGGLPRGRSILVSGECGTGKTIFGAQFIHNGARGYGEPGVLVLLEQNPEEFKRDMSAFGMDFDKLEAEGKIIIIDASLSRLGAEAMISSLPVSSESFSLLPGETTIEHLTDVVVRAARNLKASRVTIDSLPALEFLVQGDLDVRRLLLQMNYRLKEDGLTTVIVSEMGDGGYSATHGVERYVVDGVVSLHYTKVGPTAGRTLTIDKMRNTSHSEDIHTMKFMAGSGIEVLSE